MASLWDTHKGHRRLLVRSHLLPRHAQEVGLCDLVVEDDQYGGPHAVVVGGPVR